MRPGRNDPCWCGSGKKYKNCHWGRQDAPRVQAWELDKHLRERIASGECLHLGAAVGSICGKPAIGSHTVSRAMLKRIARNGHVYQHSDTVQGLEKAHGRLTVKLIGVNDASVMRVFCKRHDGPAFAPLEQARFTGSPTQCFLLGYRALCHALFEKRSALKFIPEMRGFDRGKPLALQVAMQSLIDAQAKGYELSIRDMNEQKQRFDAVLAGGDYAGIRAFIVALDRVPDILCSGAIYPEADFAGQLLQNMEDFSLKHELMTFSLIATDNGGAFVFAWHSGSNAVCRRLAASLDRLADDELPHAVVRFVLEFCGNHYFKPDWWDKAENNVKEALTARFQTSATMWLKRSQDCLADDGLRAVSWKVAGRTWV